MNLINLLKVGLIKVADKYTSFVSPFDEFTRKSFTTAFIPVEDIEKEFFNHLVTRFKLLPDQGAIIWNYKRQSDGFIDLGDQALWHGVATFMMCLRARLNPSEQMNDLVLKSANGMLYHQKEGRLIRGVNEDKYADDASNDTLTGHLLGIYGLIKYGTGSARQVGITLARNLADNIIKNNFCLTKVDDSPTTYGKLVNGYLTDGLNLSLCLVTLKLASSTVVGPIPKYDDPYYQLIKKFSPIIPYGYVTLDQLGHDYDAHRAMIAYSILADLEVEHDIKRLYIKGLMRGWQHDRKARNPWMYYLMRRNMLMDPSDKEGCLIRLSEMFVEPKSVVRERINSKDEEFWNKKGIRFFTWKGKIRSSQPLPLCLVGSQDFFWQRSQYSVDEWLGLQPGDIEHNGLDFLIAYWGFKELKFIP